MTFALNKEALERVRVFSINTELQLNFGNESFADYAYQKMADSPSARFEAAQLVLEKIGRELIWKLFPGRFLDPPIYNLVEEGAYPGTRKANLCLVMLPNFEEPLRAFVFKAYAGERLRLREVWFFDQPEYGPIDPQVFLRHYRIRKEEDKDNLALREAVLEILEKREASFSKGIFNATGDFRGALRENQRIENA